MPTEPMVGTEFAGYRLNAVISRTNMSVVYTAEHPRLGHAVALKVLAPDLASNDRFRERFVSESRMAAGIRHPNVIPIYDAGPSDGLLYIAMLYVAGADLRAILRERGRLTPDQAVLLLGQAREMALQRGAHLCKGAGQVADFVVRVHLKWIIIRAPSKGLDYRHQLSNGPGDPQGQHNSQ